MKNIKKLILVVLMLVFCTILTGCKYVEGTSQIAIRIGMNASDKFSETLSSIPVGEKSSVAIITNLQSNKQKKIVCKIVVTMEKSDIIDYEKDYTTGCIENSINISDDKKTIEYQAEVNKNTSSIPIKLQFNFTPSETGTSTINVKVYDHKGELVYSACAEKVLTFE